jgi:hypothetical protein
MRVQKLNDAFRIGLNGTGALLPLDPICVTSGVDARGSDFVQRAVKAVRDFDNFTDGNDPYGEHDFGSFEMDGVRMFWKIDYYDLEMEYGSPDPADPDLTCRVLYLAEEY